MGISVSTQGGTACDFLLTDGPNAYAYSGELVAVNNEGAANNFHCKTTVDAFFGSELPNRAVKITSEDDLQENLDIGCFWVSNNDTLADSWKVVITPNGNAQVDCYFT